MVDQHAAILDVMVVTESLFPRHVPTDTEEPRVLLHDVPWSTYVMLRDSVDSPAVHMTYLEGWLEIMSTSQRHEVDKKRIARLVELFCLERDIPLFSYGHMTVRNKAKKRGLEPDEWYCRGAKRDVPDIAFEVIVTNPLINKLEVYRGLGVKEVWVFEKGSFRILALRNKRYERVTHSAVIAEIDFDQLARHLAEPDQHAALKAFRDELRGTR